MGRSRPLPARLRLNFAFPNSLPNSAFWPISTKLSWGVSWGVKNSPTQGVSWGAPQLSLKLPNSNVTELRLRGLRLRLTERVLRLAAGHEAVDGGPVLGACLGAVGRRRRLRPLPAQKEGAAAGGCIWRCCGAGGVTGTRSPLSPSSVEALSDSVQAQSKLGK